MEGWALISESVKTISATNEEDSLQSVPPSAIIVPVQIIYGQITLLRISKMVGFDKHLSILKLRGSCRKARQ